MNQRLFQDAGGTTPAIIAGQPVGLIRRLAGSLDAVQATALSKPTLARHPKSGVRNLANGAQAVDDVTYWPVSNIVGLTRTHVARGIEGGVPYIDINVSGTPTGSDAILYATSRGTAPVVAGERLYIEATVRALTRDGDSGIRVQINEGSGIGAGYLRGSDSPLSLATTETKIQVSRVVDGAGASSVYANILIRVTPGTPVNSTYRIKGFQFVRGIGDLPLQFNYGPNDIIEPGVADLWHLYNDGGDSLNVTLPAGTYGLASIDINRAITITTITSDGTTPINTLRHERQLDVIIRAGAFTSGEETAIRDYWGRVFA